jgi:hypothetical protein
LKFLFASVLTFSFVTSGAVDCSSSLPDDPDPVSSGFSPSFSSSLFANDVNDAFSFNFS